MDFREAFDRIDALVSELRDLAPRGPLDRRSLSYEAFKALVDRHNEIVQEVFEPNSPERREFAVEVRSPDEVRRLLSGFPRIVVQSQGEPDKITRPVPTPEEVYIKEIPKLIDKINEMRVLLQVQSRQ